MTISASRAGKKNLESPIWAITSYYTYDDPPGVKRRLGVFREFRRRLQVPLLAVELSHDGACDLVENDAEIIVRVSGGALLWQKERLLNLALQSLPGCCEVVAWLDCDVVLEDDGWPVEAIRSLDRSDLIQLFSRVHFLTDGTLPDEKGNDFDVEVHRSAAGRLADGTLPDSFFPSRGGGSGIRLRCATGMAWAARREIIEEHGFYDAWIVGGGDKLMFVSALGRYDEYISRLPMTDRLREHFLDWARRFHATVRGRVGCLDGDLYHLWHGDLGSRQYRGRYELFRRFGYDPYSDIAMNEQGVWQWSSDKPEMHAFVRDFFARRAVGD